MFIGLGVDGISNRGLVVVQYGGFYIFATESNFSTLMMKSEVGNVSSLNGRKVFHNRSVACCFVVGQERWSKCRFYLYSGFLQVFVCCSNLS